MKGYLAKWLFCVFAFVESTVLSPAPSINLNTGYMFVAVPYYPGSIEIPPADWRITANGGTNVPPYRVYANFYMALPNGTDVISPFSTMDISGSYLQGQDKALFNGYWCASLSFFLPANAFDVSLAYANWYVDDRAVLLLNDQIIDSVGNICYFTNSTHDGEMVLTNGDPAVPFHFANLAEPWTIQKALSQMVSFWERQTS